MRGQFRRSKTLSYTLLIARDNILLPCMPLTSPLYAINFSLFWKCKFNDSEVAICSIYWSIFLFSRLIDNDLVKKITVEGADLIVIEGMGRAIHTNFDALFKCDSLKVAVLKNQWLAKRLGGDMFSVVFKFEKRGKNDLKMDRSWLLALCCLVFVLFF